MSTIRSNTITLLSNLFLVIACSNASSGIETVDSSQMALTSKGVTSSISYTSDWGAGYCANVTLKNGSTASVTNWKAVLSVGSVTISNSWSGTYALSGTTLTVNPASFNKSIAAGASVSFGYCANGTARPTVTSLTITGGGTGGSGGTFATGGAPATGSKPSTGGTTSSGTTLPDITNGTVGWASRYWDCCKPSCGWTNNATQPVSSCDVTNQTIASYTAKSGCEAGGTAYMCWTAAPRERSSTVSYGYAAVGNGAQCGKCYQIQFDGGIHGGSSTGALAIKGKQMIVQVISNGGVATNQFDLLIPGGGVGVLNGCSKQWGDVDLGVTYGGFLSSCNGSASCVTQKCNSVFAGKPDLRAGCNWLVNWLGATDNPSLKFKAVNCPSDFNTVMGGLQK